MSLNQINNNSSEGNEKGINTITNITKAISDDVFFIQERIGKSGATFNVYKIRTMKSNAEENVPSEVLNGDKNEGDTRILKRRKWMRKTGFDELPQMINIIKGEMTIFGSRPMDNKTYDKLTDSQRERRNEYKPGVFGGYAFFDKGKRAKKRSIRENQDVYLKIRSIKEKKGKTSVLKYNVYILIENIKALFKGVNR